MNGSLSIPTDHFYKFLAIFGLVLTIYCFSFPFLFIKPYNEKISERNIVATELSAQIGYYQGRIKDLMKFIPDSMQTKIQYYWTNSKDTSDLSYYYLSSNDSLMNMYLTELNDYYYSLSRAKFKSASIKVSNRIDIRNLNAYELISYLIGAFALILTAFGMRKWYYIQLEIDKKLKLEIQELKKKINT